MGHFCVNCGAALVPRVIEGREVEACPNDEFVLWRDPKVATAVVVEAEGGVVLGRRAIEPGTACGACPADSSTTTRTRRSPPQGNASRRSGRGSS